MLEKEEHKVTSGTKEWADSNFNCILGCLNDCRYCYAKMMAHRFGRIRGNSWRNMEIRKDILLRDFKKMTGRTDSRVIGKFGRVVVLENRPREGTFSAVE